MDVFIAENVLRYITKAFDGLKPLFGLAFSGICYVCFPEKTYAIALIAVIGAAMTDIFTKIYAICKNNGGYKNAVKTRAFFSKELWKGTEAKIVSYLIIAILTGLAYRVIYLKSAGIILGSFVYSVMFMREFQSNIENLLDAGAEVEWLLMFSKKQNKELLKPYIEEENKVGDDIEKNI